MRITKRLRRRIDVRNQAISSYLVEQGARLLRQSQFGSEFELSTPAGPWMLTLYDNWIATRFVSHRGYELATGQKSTSSKWNLHFEHQTPSVDVLSHLSWRLGKVLGCMPSPTDQRTIVSDVAKSEERRRSLREYLDRTYKQGPAVREAMSSP